MASVFRCQKVFNSISACILLRSWLSRPYHATKLNTDVLSNGGIISGRRKQNIKCCRRCFSGDSGGPKKSVSVVFTRGPLRLLSNKIKLFLVHSFFDAEFDEAKFLEGAKQAICTVSALVSQQKFGELEGLLTDEAIQSLSEEINEASNAETYQVTMEDILQTTIHDIGFQYDEREKGRKWLHVLVSFICRSNEQHPSRELGNITFIRIPFPKITRYSFRKECTLGIEDSWIITKVINFSQNTPGAP